MLCLLKQPPPQGEHRDCGGASSAPSVARIRAPLSCRPSQNRLHPVRGPAGQREHGAARAGGSGTGPGRGPLASLYIPLQSELGNNHFSCAHAEKEVALVTFSVFCHATHRSHIFVPFSCVFLRSVGDLRPLSAGTQLEKRVKIEVCFLFLRMPPSSHLDIMQTPNSNRTFESHFFPCELLYVCD